MTFGVHAICERRSEKLVKMLDKKHDYCIGLEARVAQLEAAGHAVVETMIRGASNSATEEETDAFLAALALLRTTLEAQ